MVGAQHGAHCQCPCRRGYTGLKDQGQILTVTWPPPNCNTAVTMADFLGLGLGDSRACRREQACGQSSWSAPWALQPWLPTLLAIGTGNGGAQRGGGTSALLAVDGGGRDRLKGGEMPVGGSGTGAQSGPASQARAGLRAGVHVCRSRGAWAWVSPGQALDESLMTWCPCAAGPGCVGHRKRRGLIKGGSQKPLGLPLPALGAAGLLLGRGWAGGCSRRLWVCGPAWTAPGTPCDP